MTANPIPIKNLYSIATGNAPGVGPIYVAHDPTTSNNRYPLYQVWINTTTKAIWVLTSFTTSAGQLSANWNALAPIVTSTSAPTTSDYEYPLGQPWLDTSTNGYYILVAVSGTTATWVALSSSSGSAINTITGNSGGAVGPDSSNNINVLGDTTSGISIAGSSGTNTLTATLSAIPNSSLSNSSITLSNGTGITITGSPVSLGGTATIATTAFTQIANQVFTISGTYTPTSGMDYCIIEVLGGGGGGGGNVSTTASPATFANGGGGGAGEYARGIFSAATVGVSQTVTIGAGGAGSSGATGSTGGTTSVGALITAVGGLGGTAQAASEGTVLSFGGVGGGVTGGSGTGGQVRTPGGCGDSALGLATVISAVTYSANSGAKGADSQYGSGGAQQYSNASGNNALGYGAGGGGAAGGSGTGPQAGGSGSNGVVIITELITA